MQLEDFIHLEINRLIKFMVWWSYKSSFNEKEFPAQMAAEDWQKQYILHGQSGQSFSVPAGYQLEDYEVDAIRSDLLFQLKTPEDLDWNYFLETAIRAKVKADATGVNMTLDKQ